MKFRLFFTYIIVLASSWGLMEAIWLNASQMSDLYYGNISSWRPIPFMLAAVVTGLLWVVWNFEIKRSERDKVVAAKQEESIEKKKRERIDSVLRDLSDEALLRLRHRLLDGTINDEKLEDALMGEDGEIVYGARR